MITVRQFEPSDRRAWDRYVNHHRDGVLYHLSGWKKVIEKTYGHNSYYLIAEETKGNIIGILPLVHIKHILFDNSLISIPYFDMAGLLTNSEEIGSILIENAIEIAKKVKIPIIELRGIDSWAGMDTLKRKTTSFPGSHQFYYKTKSNKVRMLLSLPEASESLWKLFKSKHRNKIKKPLNEGLYPKIGGKELLSDFYSVFSVNMRDLGSPVHSKNLIQNVLAEFPQQAKIAMVYKEKKPLACGFFITFKSIVENPWSSFLRAYASIRPNYLLYWAMLEYACDKGYEYFDFGRSSIDEGTYKFKVQWGAKPDPLYWQCISLNNNKIVLESEEKVKFKHLIAWWKKIPLPLTQYLGPIIRKNIGL